MNNHNPKSNNIQLEAIWSIHSEEDFTMVLVQPLFKRRRGVSCLWIEKKGKEELKGFGRME